MLLALCCSSYGRKVKGSVTCGREKLEGVIVTDGKNFTTTSGNGKFAFEISDDAEFVFIVTPSGYVADWTSGVPAFYIPVEGTDRFDFKLTKTGTGYDYHIVAIADPQTHTDKHMEECVNGPLADVAGTVEGLTYPAVGVTLGDIAWDNSEMLGRYKTEIVRMGIPFYPVIGNHDHEAFCKGDDAAAAAYRKEMGPTNYAFCLGKDVVIVLDNVIYDTDFKSTMGYTDEIIAWVRGLEKLIPSDAEVYVAQHVPFTNPRKKLSNGNALLDILRGRKVTFLSGHSHENYNYEIEKNVTEHNVAAICGAWWDTVCCADGTPRGYKVFTREGGKLSWYYKPADDSRELIAKAYGLGQTNRHPNSIVVNVWDWDPQWKVEWYEDGAYKGKMDAVNEISPDFSKNITEAYMRYGEEIPGWKRPGLSGHFFAATPGRYAEKVTVSVTGRFGQKWVKTFDLADYEEVEKVCHTLSDAKTAVDEGVNMLRMEVFSGQGGQVMVGNPEGEPLGEVLDGVEAYIKQQGCSPIRYHIEITPYKRYHELIDACMKELWPRYLGDRLLITCPEGLMKNFLKEMYPEVHVTDQPSRPDGSMRH